MDNGGWRRFQKLKINKKNLSKRARKMETATTRHANRFVVSKLNSIRDVRRHIVGWLSIVGLLIIAVTAQMIWFESSYRTTAAIKGGTYAEGMLGPIDTLNPLYAKSHAELSVSRLLFSSLYDYDNTGHLRPDIATGISLDSTERIYTVTLRKDVKWHDGTNLTADDVVFTVNLMKNPDSRALLQSSWSGITAQALDEHTVQFTLPRMYAAFGHALTFAVLPKHILGSVDPGSMRENTYSLAPIGSGPFSLSYYQSMNASTDKIVHMTAWKQYYQGAPKLSRFEIHSYGLSSDISKAVQQHEVNAAFDLNDSDIAKLQGTTVGQYPVNSGVYALLNTRSQVLKDKQVRKAMQLGTDTAALRRSFLIQKPALDYPFIPSQITGAPLPLKPAYNTAKAMSLLDQAGWKLANDGTRSKDGVKLAVRLVALKDSQYTTVMQNLSEQWRKLGFTVNIMQFDPTQTDQSFAQAILQPRDYDVLVNELSIGGDPDVYAYWHSSQVTSAGLNFTNYKNDIVDDTLFSARLKNDTTLRDQKYRSFAQIWLDDAPAIGLYQSAVEYTHSAKTTSLPSAEILPTITDRYNNVIYWTADQGHVYKTP